MKKTLTLALLFCIGTAIGQVTKYALPYKSDTLRGYAYFSDTSLYVSIKPSKLAYNVSKDIVIVFKGKQYEASELIEMLEWFRENKPKKDTFHLSTKPIRFYRLGDYPDYSNKDSLKSTIYKGANGDYITLQQTKTELLLDGSPYISKTDVEKHYKPRKRQKNGKQLLR